MTTTQTDTALAVTLMYAYFRVLDAARPIDRRLALAEFTGMAKAAHALGVGVTPTHVENTVIEIARPEHPNRPGYNAGNNTEQKVWFGRIAFEIADALDSIR